MRSRRWKGFNHFHLLDLIHQEDGKDHAKNCLSQNEKFYEAKNFFFIKSTYFYLPFYVKPRVHLALKLKIKKINFWSLLTKFFLSISFISDNTVTCAVGSDHDKKLLIAKWNFSERFFVRSYKKILKYFLTDF